MGKIFSKGLAPRPVSLKVEKQIGQGADGSVHKGRLGTHPVAVKKVGQLLIDHSKQAKENLETVVEDFRIEYEQLSKIEHPNLVKLYGIYEEGRNDQDSGALIVMDLMETNLETFLKKNAGAITFDKQVDICQQIATALLFLHSLKPDKVHGNLTVRNVFVNLDATDVKLSDIGGMKFRPSDIQLLGAKYPSLMPYLPPELPKGNKWTRKSDIFSFGVLMLQIATQKSPIPGVVVMIGQPEVERRRSDLNELSNDHLLKPVILQCLKDDPSERPSIRELYDFLNNLRLLQTDHLLSDELILNSSEAKPSPVPFVGASGVLLGSNIYIGGGAGPDVASEQLVQVYHVESNNWTILPPSPQYWSELALLNGQVTLVGGFDASSGKVTDRLSSWNGLTWEEVFPPLPVKRLRPGVVVYSKYMFVVGGLAEDLETLLDNMDILNTDTKEWISINEYKLPVPLSWIKLAVAGNHLVITSPRNGLGAVSSINEAWCLTLKGLLRSLTGEGNGNPASWETIEDTTMWRCALLNNAKVPTVVGGHDSTFDVTAEVHVYQAQSNTWERVGRLQTARIQACVVPISATKFFVVGGSSDRSNSTIYHTAEMVELI